MNQLREEPLISVIIPTYNRADIINVSLNSVVNQSYQNIEIIVVDDGSTDHTEEVVKSIGDPRIHYVKHLTNRGGSATRNTGIESAKGEYIAFLDSDDAWFPNKLKLQLNAIQSHACPEKVVSYTQVIYCPSGIVENIYPDTFDQKFLLPKQAKALNETVADYLFCQQGKLLTSTLMLPRLLALDTRFQEGLKKHQDWDFSLRLEAKGAVFLFVPEPLTLWNGDPRLEHVGRSGDYRVSEKWLHERRSYISSRAATAFLLEKVLPSVIQEKKRRLYAQKIIIEAFLQKIITFRRFRNLSSQVWTP